MPIINEFIFAQAGVSANYEMYGQEFILEIKSHRALFASEFRTNLTMHLAIEEYLLRNSLNGCFF